MSTVEYQSSIAATGQRVGVVAADDHARTARRDTLTAGAFPRWTKTVARDRLRAAVAAVERWHRLLCRTRNRRCRKPTPQRITRGTRRMTGGCARVAARGLIGGGSDPHGGRCRGIRGAEPPSRRPTSASNRCGHPADDDHGCERSEVHAASTVTPTAWFQPGLIAPDCPTRAPLTSETASTETTGCMAAPSGADLLDCEIAVVRALDANDDSVSHQEHLI